MCEGQQFALLADAVDQIGVLVIEHICSPMAREQHIGKLLEDVRHLIAMPVPRHLLKTSIVLWNRADVTVIGKARSLGIDREAVSNEPMMVLYAELTGPICLRYLVHDHVPILPPMEEWQQHQSRVGDEQDFP